MEFMSESWFPELEMEEPLLVEHGENMDLFEEYLATMGEEFQNCLSSENDSCNSDLIQRIGSTNSLCTSVEVPPPSPPPPPPPPQIDTFVSSRPAKQAKSNSFLPNVDQPPSAPFILSFGNSKKSQQGQKRSAEEAAADLFLNCDEPSPKGNQVTKKGPSRVRPASQTYDHIIAERKRREQLSQLFVALSAIVPGLKKMDKTSVLGEAIKYLKQLQQRVNKLEEQSTKQTMESVVLVRRSQLSVDEDDEGEDSSDENPAGSTEDPLPEIEARVCGRSVLIRIHCEKYKGVLLKILSEIEKLHLVVINTNVATFGSLAFVITIIAEMEEEFSSTTRGIVRTLRSALIRVNSEAI